MALARAAGAGGTLRLLVFLGRIYGIAFPIAIMMADPGHAEGQTVFVAPFGDKIEEVIRAHQNVQSPRIAGIGMKDFARRILGEDAGTRTFFAGELALGVVVLHLASGLFFRREGNVIVKIEIASERRDPLKLPAHALLEGFDLGERRARNHRERGVAIGQVRGRAVEMIRHLRAAWATRLPAGAEHEVVHNELAAAAEKIGPRYFALGRIKFITLLDLFPRQGAALAAQFIAQAGELFLFFQELAARGQPILYGKRRLLVLLRSCC